MNDRHVREDLLEFALGESGPDGAEEIERHLADCSACSSELERLRNVIRLVEAAPLEPAPPETLREEAFLKVEHARTVALLESAPLSPEPDPGMADRVLSDARLNNVASLAGARKKEPSRGLRALAALGAAALIVALGFSVWRIGALTNELEGLKNQDAGGNPPGHSMQTVAVAGVGINAELELVHFRHDNYRLELTTDDFPVQKEGHHYEVWLKGESGESKEGSFRILRPDRITFHFNVGIDPADYPRVEIIEEPDAGSPKTEGEVVARGRIDPAHVEHD